MTSNNVRNAQHGANGNEPNCHLPADQLMASENVKQNDNAMISNETQII
jgi:hypothetical protein